MKASQKQKYLGLNGSTTNEWKSTIQVRVLKPLLKSLVLIYHNRSDTRQKPAFLSKFDPNLVIKKVYFGPNLYVKLKCKYNSNVLTFGRYLAKAKNLFEEKTKLIRLNHNFRHIIWIGNRHFITWSSLSLWSLSI